MRGIHWLRGAVIGATVVLFANAQTTDEALIPIDHPAIQYNQNLVNDRETRVIRDMKGGKTKLTSRGDGTGTLSSLLQALEVNPDSQILAFAKTSFQVSRISPRNPRAIYFSDHVATGYVRGSDLLEVAAFDPKQGFIFYSFDQQGTRLAILLGPAGSER